MGAKAAIGDDVLIGTDAAKSAFSPSFTSMFG